MLHSDDIRVFKTTSEAMHTYHLNGTQIVAEEWSNKLLIYLYDANGSPIGMQYRTTSDSEGEFDTYWFEKNLQGDIIAVYNDAGTLLVKYVYDAWGNTVSTTYSNGGASTIVRYNRFRYRGYYYDNETGFYYLNSRYYDPSTGRFINADGLLFGSLLGSNLYAYCENSPTIWQDPSGNAKEKVVDFDAECPLKLWPNGLDGGMSSSQCWMTGQDRYYSYGVDLSFAARSSLFHGGIYNCGYTFYSYYNTTGLYDSSSYSGTTYVTNGLSSYGNITSESPVGRIPYDRQTLNHIFSNRPGHICDSHSNRTLLESTTIKSNYLTTDIYGNDWYAQTLSDGRQVWVEVQGTRIWDGGINIVPRPWNSETGLKKRNK